MSSSPFSSKSLAATLVGLLIFSIPAPFSYALGSAQQKVPATQKLEAGAPVERQLAAGETHSYAITLTAGQFAHVNVDQRGVDVVVSSFSPDNTPLGRVDAANAERGIEPLFIVADTAGTYRVDVYSQVKKAPTARYQINFTELRPATADDRNRLAAQRLMTEAKELENQHTVASAEAAIQKFQEALATWTKLNDQMLQAYALCEIGVIYGDTGKYQKALDVYAQARPLYHSIPDPYGEAGILVNIGWIYSMLNDDQKALAIYDDVLAMYNKLGEVDPIVLSNIGASYAAVGQFQKALDIHLRVLELRRAGNSASGIGITLNNIANCYKNLGDKQKALEYYQQALIHIPEVGNSFYTAAVLTNIGALHRELGDAGTAINYFNQSLVIRQTIGDENGGAATLEQIAKLERGRGNLVESRKHIEAALANAESLRANVSSQELRAAFFAQVQRYREFYIDLLMRLHEQKPTEQFDVEAFEASEKGRARSLLELIKEAGAEIRKGVEPSLLERERVLGRTIGEKAEAQSQMLRGEHTEAQATGAAKEIGSLTRQLEEVQAQIREKSPQYAALRQPVPLGLKQIQQQVLDADTLLLEYSLGKEKSFVWAVTPDSIRSFELPNRETIEPAARRVYDLLVASQQGLPYETLEQRQQRFNRIDQQLADAAAELSRMIIAPVASVLGNKRLLIVGDSLLQLVPFAVLPAPQAADSHPLIVEHEIVTAPSASVVAVLRQETSNRAPAKKALAVFADPVFTADDPRVAAARENRPASAPIAQHANASRFVDGSGVALRRLRFSRQEAEEITRYANGSAKLEALDFAANRSLATSAELSQYRIVHFATHGIINNDHPELSGIVLSLVDEKGHPQNGFLRLYDLYNLRLSADLVVLSACQTAFGKDIRGEGLISLTRGFMYAGAPRVVASLWQVDDRASAELMKRFYENMLGRGLRPAAALRAAQVELLNDKRWRAPHYWAAFTIQGEWK
jgi:CHAT domain-containing protein/tetratricopeptide (TPR) repeat protein